MKQLFGYILSVTLLIGCTPDPSYTVSGVLTGAENGEIIIKEYLGKKRYSYLDTATIEDGKFQLEGRVPYPKWVILDTETQKNRIGFWLENSTITIEAHIDSLSNIKIDGSISQHEYKESMEFMMPSTLAYREVSQKRSTIDLKDSAQIIALEEELDAAHQNSFDATIAYIKDHPSSYPAASMIKSISHFLTWDELDSVISMLDPEIIESGAVSKYIDRVEKLKKVSIGSKATNLQAHDTTGVKVDLYQFLKKHELVLVDFWASWCMPCRREHPNLRTLYSDFHQYGFNILSISLDDTKENWIKAINKDELPWPQVSNLIGFEDPATNDYAVSAIPTSYIMDSEGTILAKNLKGTRLRAFIEQELNKK